MHERDPEIAERDLEADVAHHGRDDRVALQTPLGLQLAPAHQQHVVAVHETAAMIDEDRAIPVPVERHSHLTAGIDDGFGEPLGMRGPAPQVDVPPIGPVADDDRLDAELLEQRRRHSGRRAVGAIERDFETRRRLLVRQHRRQMIEVRPRKIRGGQRPGLAAAAVHD